MTRLSDNSVLLFFKNYETDKWLPGDRYLKRVLRPVYDRFHRRQKITGFESSFRLLVKALQRSGYEVHCNDYRRARRHPEHPVGLYGYPDLLDTWDLDNPAVLGSGLYDHPVIAPTLMQDPRNRYYLVGCEWVRRMFEPHYGDNVGTWFAGIDLAEWPDTRSHTKDIDVLVYDKIYWERGKREEDLLHPILRRLSRRGLRVEVIRYKLYDHATYRALLSRARSMVLLSAHETQGIASAEALASNVPVLAWDNGYWLDPRRPLFEPDPVSASSVPYFSEECGERFRDFDAFEDAFGRFWSQLGSYEPRRYVARELSFEKSARRYMHYYRRAATAAVEG